MDYGIYAVGVFVVLLSGAVAAWYLRGAQRGESNGFFAPRMRRLSALERLHIEGGRKLVLVRRDNVEHLILIGGPIDLVVESNIQPEQQVAPYPSPVEALDGLRPAVMPFPGAREPSLSVPDVDAEPEPIRLKSADAL
jgi:hypothetical protein